ncbi:hypothetical protein OF83DRAFT_1180383 [Amylostereum chailletii]|nr:hypothetical protein OF83DRAFT_1180383 [Amylostereum chailletii]
MPPVHDLGSSHLTTNGGPSELNELEKHAQTEGTASTDLLLLASSLPPPPQQSEAALQLSHLGAACTSGMSETHAKPVPKGKPVRPSKTSNSPLNIWYTAYCKANEPITTQARKTLFDSLTTTEHEQWNLESAERNKERSLSRKEAKGKMREA